MKQEWAETIRDQCLEQGVPFFFKQWGAFDSCGRRVGKGRAGRELCGRTWDEMPLPPAKDGRVLVSPRPTDPVRLQQLIDRSQVNPMVDFAAVVNLTT